MDYRFPADFIWGVSTAAAQIEGAIFEDGRGPSIWDVFCRLPGTIKNGDRPDVSCDSYHHLERDVAMLKELGVKSYRFSFSWPRILPNGTGEVNLKGVAYYKKLLALLKENNILPNATIYHWDLPYALQIKGGFGNRDIIKWYMEYANVLFDNFGGDVAMWATFNEPISIFVGYAKGFFAPGLADEKYARQCLHHALLCHGEAVREFRRRNFPDAKIGVVVDVWKHYPARTGNADDIASAAFQNEIEGYDMFLHPLFLGGYSEAMKAHLEKNGLTPEVQDGDFETIRQPLDFYGLNFYNGLYDNVEEIERKKDQETAGGNFQDRPENHVEAVYDVLHMLKEHYKIDVPIYITENNIPQDGDAPKEALLDDQERIDYVRSVLTWLHKAIGDGIDVRGYYLWSLMDNFEWTAGYAARYGLYYTDYETLETAPKKSAGRYRGVIAVNGF